jgi:pimeloyl-ACP methyl ester carboxylesterase
MHAINQFRRPRPESALDNAELAAISTPTMFIWGSGDLHLSPAAARPSIDRVPNAKLEEVPGGHAPWLIDARRTGGLIQVHLAGVVATDHQAVGT